MHHAFGRSGFGALMGAKALKAIVVKGSGRKVDVADPEKFDALRRTLTERTLASDVTKAFRAYGTAFNLEGGMQIGDVPIRNWTSNLDEEMGRTLNGATLAQTYLVKEKGCMFCAINCKRKVAVNEGPFAVSEGVGPEYESIVSLGSLLGSSDLAAACKANRQCNEYGMDTISAGGTIAWAMEAFEKGHLKPEDFDGISIDWGDMACVTDTILPKIAAREGQIGALLADGSVSASERTGPETRAYTAHSKRLEAPMHDPRGGGHGLALSYATNARGACHVADAMLFIEMGFSHFPEVNLEHKLEPMSDSHKAEYAVLAQEFGAVKNSACWCVFADLTFTITDWVGLFNTVPGYDWDVRAMMQAGRRIVYMKRLINHRYGMRAKDDALTPRMLEPARDGLPKGKEIKFEEMKSEYYRLFGIDPVEGIPGEADMRACGMTEQD
jgi:aldehyde:ferredoxin oxidoreductase